MEVQVERCAGHLGLEKPMRLRFGRREVQIVDRLLMSNGDHGDCECEHHKNP
jgi:hypothetical protein